MNRSAEHVTKSSPQGPLAKQYKVMSQVSELTQQVSLVVKFYIVDHFLMAF